MPDPRLAYSEPFLDATRSEADRLRAEAEQLRAAAADHLAAAERISAAALSLEQRVQELDELLGRAPQLRLDLDSEGLRGQRLREVAVEILARNRGLGQPIHYRDWYKLVKDESGQDIEAKDPLATFLIHVSRSPLVTKAEDPGVYRLDPEGAGKRALQAVEVAEQALADAEAEYSAAREEPVIVDQAQAAAARRRLDTMRRRLAHARREMAEIARTQTELREVVGS
jgi:hypothetical protein